MQVKELGHVVLYVRDLERSRWFYGDVLGFPELPGGMPGAAAFSTGRTHHELLLIEVGPDATPIPAGRRVGMYHLGLKVGDTDDELRDALATAEMVVRDRIVLQGRALFGAEIAADPGFECALDITLQLMIGAGMSALLHKEQARIDTLISEWKTLFPALLGPRKRRTR